MADSHQTDSCEAGSPESTPSEACRAGTPIPAACPADRTVSPPRAAAGEGRRRVIIIIITATLCLLVTIVVIGKLSRGDFKDAAVWYDAGRRVLTGQSLVGLRSYRYPPTFAVLISPLCVVPFPAFFLLWYAINLCLFLLSLRLAVSLTFGSCRWADLPRYWVPVALVAVLAIDNLFLGQTNILVMALVYLALLEAARNREWRAGLSLAAAVAVKVFPLPLIGYFLYRWRLRAVAATLLSCLFVLLLLPAPVRGFQRNFAEFVSWGERVVMPYLSQGKAGDWGQHALDFGNQSLQAVAHRYLSHVNAYVMARNPDTDLYVNFTNLTEKQINQVVLALFAVLLLSFLAACGRKPPGDNLEQATEYSLAIIVVLLASALSWTYFFVMLLLPITAAIRLLQARERLRDGSLWALRLALWAWPLATVLLFSSYARALGSLCWATLILYAALALARRDLRLPQAGADRRFAFQLPRRHRSRASG